MICFAPIDAIQRAALRPKPPKPPAIRYVASEGREYDGTWGKRVLVNELLADKSGNIIESAYRYWICGVEVNYQLARMLSTLHESEGILYLGD